MVGCRDTSDVAKKAAELHRKKSNNWPIVSFIYNGSEITTWMGHSFKTKSPTSRATFLPCHFKDNFFFEFHLISTSTLELYANSLKQLFLQLHLRKKKLAVHFTKGYFFVNLLTEKFYWQCHESKYILFWIYKSGFYFISLRKIIMSKQR